MSNSLNAATSGSSSDSCIAVTLSWSSTKPLAMRCAVTRSSADPTHLCSSWGTNSLKSIASPIRLQFLRVRLFNRVSNIRAQGLERLKGVITGRLLAVSRTAVAPPTAVFPQKLRAAPRWNMRSQFGLHMDFMQACCLEAFCVPTEFLNSGRFARPPHQPIDHRHHQQ